MAMALHERFQSAYKAHHSTETVLLTITDDILLSLDRRNNVFQLLLDLSAAFNTVNHSLLLSRLENSFGITGTVLQWFHSYLTGRSQFVEINDTKSSTDSERSAGLCSRSHFVSIVHCTTC